jgi:hypothetical protein
MMADSVSLIVDEIYCVVLGNESRCKFVVVLVNTVGQVICYACVGYCLSGVVNDVSKETLTHMPLLRQVATPQFHR